MICVYTAVKGGVPTSVASHFETNADENCSFNDQRTAKEEKKKITNNDDVEKLQQQKM